MFNIIRFLQYFFIFYISSLQTRKMANRNENQATNSTTSRGKKVEKPYEIYACQCGKNYLTFSALYLHVKIKHDIRLSTRKSEHNYKIEQEGAKKIITYFLKQPSLHILNHSQNSLLEAKNKGRYFKHILQRYRDHLRQTLALDLPQKAQFLALMEDYIDEITDKLENDSALPKDLAMYFNQFALYYLPARTHAVDPVEAARRHAEDLMALWKWLKMQGFTKLELQLHELYRNTRNS